MPFNNYFGTPGQPYQTMAGYGPAPTPTPAYRPQQQTCAGNKIYVTSQEDALSRFVEPGTVMLYVRQDEQVEYEVFSDYQGRKNIVVYSRTPANGIQPQDAPKEACGEYVTADKFDALTGRIEALERLVGGDKA